MANQPHNRFLGQIRVKVIRDLMKEMGISGRTASALRNANVYCRADLIANVSPDGIHLIHGIGRKGAGEILASMARAGYLKWEVRHD